MLFKALMELLQALILGLVMAFPDYTLPRGPGLSALAAANIVLPIDVFVAVIGASVSLMSVALSVWVITTAIKLLKP